MNTHMIFVINGTYIFPNFDYDIVRCIIHSY